MLRGFAILAMLVAHATPLMPDKPFAVAFVMTQLNDVASPLFALVMGMSSQIVVQRTPTRAERWVLVLQQVARGLILVALGMWMSSWGTWVAIILSFLGLLLILGLPFLFLPSRWLLGVTVALFAISDPLNSLARSSLTWVYSDPTGFLPMLAQWAVLHPSYRLTNLLPFFLLGALLLRRASRHGFRRDRLLTALIVAAPIAYIARPLAETLWHVPALSGNWADTAHDLGLVLAVYAAVVLAATAKGPTARRVVSAVFLPLRAIGGVALSLYVLHVGLLALHGPMRPADNDWLWWLAIVIGVVAAGWAWWRFVGPGPIEWLMGWVSGRPRRRQRTAA